jgi:allantoinase
MKHLELGNFRDAWGGISSLQLSLPVTWTEARRRGFTIEHMAVWMSLWPAELVGLDDRKGRLAPGYDADIVIWDPDASLRVRAETLYHRNTLTPYDKDTLYGKVVETYVGGVRVYHEGAVSDARLGTCLTRSRVPAGEA